jgi:alpha-ketoglutarate-dependent taurine dioxygenase
MTAKQAKTLNGDFGIVIEGVTRDMLEDPSFQQEAVSLWQRHGGVFIARGSDLEDATPDEILAWSRVFGTVHGVVSPGRENMMVGDTPILRIGNARDDKNRPVAQQSDVPPLTSDDDVRYNPKTRRPVWHTDFGASDRPVGTVFHCRVAPPEGGDTLFADMRAGFASLPPDRQRELEGLEAICSQAHHDKKISLYTPGYPTLTAEQRAASPTYRLPLVLRHPETGIPAIYGLNSSTSAVVPKGTPITQEQMDKWDLEGIEDESMAVYHDLLPHLTGPEFTVRWRWRAGDIVTWDNRSTMHSATGFDSARFPREMWRVTLSGKGPALREAA